MADTSLIEVARQTHEEAERYQQALVDLLLSSATSSSTLTHKDKLKRAHKASDLLDRVASRYQYLDRFYADEHGDRQRELDALSSTRPAATGTTTDGDDDAFGEFYERLGRVRDYHERYPGALPDTFSVEFGALEAGGSSHPDAGSSSVAAAGYAEDFVDRMFSGEEMAGRFLDLYVHHEAYLNLKGAKRLSYLSYIDDVGKLAGPSSPIPNHAKKTDAYRTYLTELRRYLDGFMRKTQPLANVDNISAKAVESFEEAWERGTVEGWEQQGAEVFGAAGASKANVGDGAGLGQGEVGEQGIWCVACRRFYAKQTVYDAHLKAPKHLKAAARQQSAGDGAATPGGGAAHSEAERVKARVRGKALARDECIITALAHELTSIRADTKSNVERKAALTDRERQAEAEAASDELNRMTALNPTSGLDGDVDEATGMDEDEDGLGRVYNPLKLPLGWDGRPIPFWLYKLHGLRNEFKCEICSDHVYHGRKAFEKHFTESRHAFGMRALGLPNTVQFRDVTSIADALALAEKLRRQGKVDQANAGVDGQEVEDEHGNSYTKKTYDLLKRQGLI